MNVGSFPKWMGDPVLWLLYGFWAVTLYKLFEEKFLVWALRRGDYEGALKVVGRFHFYHPEGGPALMRRGAVLVIAGRFGEAEGVLRRALVNLHSHAVQASVLELLGDALLEQGR